VNRQFKQHRHSFHVQMSRQWVTKRWAIKLMAGLSAATVGLAAAQQPASAQLLSASASLPAMRQTIEFEEPLPPLPAPELFLPSEPVFPSFNSQRLDEQLQLYAAHLRQYGVPDVLIVGSSRSLQGVDPGVLQQALVAQGYPELRIYNFGINGATARVIDLLLQRILTPEQLPRLILWADGSRAFNSGRADVTYNGIVASDGYKMLETGVQPIAGQAVSPIVTDLQPTGFLAVSTRFDPATYYRQHPRVAGRYDTNYIPFRLEGEQTAATIALAEFAQAQQITLVFVNLPLSRDYLDSTRQQYEQQFRRHMQQLAAREEFIFRDLSQRWQTQNGYFADPSHLNQYGAEAVSRQLAIDPAIPWQITEAAIGGRLANSR